MAGALQSLVAASFCWFLASSAAIYPHHLSYFNEAVRGPLNGPKHLLGSNVDWGQDERYRSWLSANTAAVSWWADWQLECQRLKKSNSTRALGGVAPQHVLFISENSKQVVHSSLEDFGHAKAAGRLRILRNCVQRAQRTYAATYAIRAFVLAPNEAANLSAIEKKDGDSILQ